MTTASRSATADCLAGGGEMGALMRSFDWSTTRLGPVAHWPQSLRTAVSIMLDSAFAMVIAWGPEFVFLYNDRYRPVLGATKHPGALGRPAKEIFPEVWGFIGPLFEKTRNGESVALDDMLIPLDRNGYLEDCYFTLSYSAIRDESGGVGGMLAVIAETTERVQGQRRMVTLRDLAALGDARNADEACRRAETVLARNPVDVPFSLLYLLQPERRGASLAAVTGVMKGAAAAPGEFALDDARWPLGEAYGARRMIVVDDLPARFGVMPGGPYLQPAHTALVLPMPRAGHDEPHGFFVVGVSPRRALDDRYRTFFELCRDHVVAAIDKALAFDEERKRAEALAEIDRAKTAFFSNISHEFRTPLTLLLGPLEDAVARGTSTPDELGTAFRNALRLQKLVNALLDFSRIEAGRAQATYVPTNISRVTTELAAMFESAMMRAGLRYVLHCDAIGEPIYLDPDMYEKIVLNLLSNALKFTFDGEVELALHDAGDRVELRVRDTGVGIAPDAVPRLFERFHRIEGTRARTHEGSGIGLALVNDLVKLHGGSVRADSTLGAGTTFTVALPKGKTHLPADKIGAAVGDRVSAASSAILEEVMSWLREPADRSATVAPAEPVEPAASLRARVLVVDDNADMRGYLRSVLAPHVAVEAVRDSGAALEAARRAPPDLVLTDVMMPNLDGIGLVRALRADERTRAVPVVMLSARAGEEARVDGLRAGADDYLVKPFSARELIARVRTHLELSRLRREADLHASRLNTLFEQAPAAICVLAGPDHVYRLVNPPCLEAIGNRPVIGRTVRQAMPELEGQGIIELLDRVYATGERYVDAEVPILLQRGAQLEQTYWNVIFQPYRDVEGNIEGVMTFGFEITMQVLARQRAEALTRQVQASEARADAANRAKDEFLAVLSHELRNPLAPILTALQILRLRDGGTCAKERAIIERQAQHLVRLVDDLLDVSRITRGKIELKISRVELADVVARAIEMSSPVLEHRQHHLDVHVPSRGLAVDGDPDRLAQVVSNLLTNAAKYTERGGRITVSAERHGDGIAVRVQDTGIGIASEMLPRVFDMFVQEPQALDRSRGGLGLGLTIVRSLVAMHGGTVDVHSEGRNRGSEFVVTLPAAVVRPPAASDGTAEPNGARRGDAAGGHRILVVDDNEDAADLLASALEIMGYTARVAHDGPAALKLAAEFDPDLALLDIGLPVMDGYELARRLHDDPGLRRVPLVAVTGYGQPADRQRSEDAGFDAHLVKPIDIERVGSLIRQLTGGGP
ncbi:MAG TPA: ATP-binding protein [Kofleriaceae bacterium]|nr:ATP-binding protein [Kofleriaceae bacterium]